LWILLVLGAAAVWGVGRGGAAAVPAVAAFASAHASAASPR
jgi:hypothetical protein